MASATNAEYMGIAHRIAQNWVKVSMERATVVDSKGTRPKCVQKASPKGKVDSKEEDSKEKEKEDTEVNHGGEKVVPRERMRYGMRKMSM